MSLVIGHVDPAWHRVLLRACSSLFCHIISPYRFSCRFQTYFGENRPSSHRSSLSHRHPLSNEDPAHRNVALPHQSHTNIHRHDALPPEILKQKAQKALLRQMQESVLWEGTVIRDRNHSLAQHFLKLRHNTAYRYSHNLFFITGKDLLRETIEQNNSIPNRVLVRDGLPPPKWLISREIELAYISSALSNEISPGNDGYIGEFDIPRPPDKEELIGGQHRFSRVLVLNNVEDPGTLGTLLRTAAGFQYDAIFAINHCADLYSHEVLRAARGVHFQHGTPFYTFNEEDGDDVFGMLNHVMLRNSLIPVCYLGKDDMFSESGSDSPCVSRGGSLEGIDSLPSPSRERKVDSDRGEEANYGDANSKPSLHYSPASSMPQCPLSLFCHRQFFPSARVLSNTNKATTLQPSFSTPAEFHTPPSTEGKEMLYGFKPPMSFSKESGQLIILSPNHSQRVGRVLQHRLLRPLTQLKLLPETEVNFMMGASIILHALRPRAEWDFLPLSQQASPNDISTQTAHGCVDFGDNRPDLNPLSINMDEDEQRRTVANLRLRRKETRLNRRRQTDYEAWMSAELTRLRALARLEKTTLQSPWNKIKKSPKFSGADQLSEEFPNIINDFRMPLDRDLLRRERQRAETDTRPRNYDYKITVQSSSAPFKK